MSELALFGGTPLIQKPLTPYRSIGEEERRAVDTVLRSGMLSGYVGAWCEAFNGGPAVQEFENAWVDTFGCRHAIAVNSNTSGLIAAIGAAGIGPGDEVIVPPTTMSATAIAPIFYGGIPVFVDIEADTFCLDIVKVEDAVTPRTRAILAVNLFGHPARLHELRALADRHGLILIEDNAQAPMAREGDRFTGTIGHIGVFSLNYHKHIHTGEGGICATDDDRLADRLRMIRNHGENVTEELATGNLSNIVGYNFRLTEMSAAVGIEQLKKAERLVSGREQVGQELSLALGAFDGMTAPVVRGGCRHVYYLWAGRFDADRMGVSRELFAQALEAEGVPLSLGYVKPLYLLPLFQKRIALGRDGFPFTLTNRTYAPGLCPVAERMYEKELFEFFVCSYEFAPFELSLVIDAFAKVYENRRRLGSAAAR